MTTMWLEYLLYSALIVLLINKVSGSTIFYGNIWSQPKNIL